MSDSPVKSLISLSEANHKHKMPPVLVHKERKAVLSTAVNTCNPSTAEAEAGVLHVPGQPGLYSEFK